MPIKGIEFVWYNIISAKLSSLFSHPNTLTHRRGVAIYSLQIQAEKGLPTAEEAYNFFTFNFEPEPQDGTEKISRKSKKTKGTAEEDRDDDEEGGEEVERENADVDEDNQDENEDQVRQQSHCKRCCVYHLFCICSRIRPSRFQMPHTLHPASE